MKFGEFINIVSTMRAAQRSYFRTRSQESLQYAKKLESMVDEAVEELTKPDRQPELFDNQN